MARRRLSLDTPYKEAIYNFLNPILSLPVSSPSFLEFDAGEFPHLEYSNASRLRIRNKDPHKGATVRANIPVSALVNQFYYEVTLTRGSCCACAMKFIYLGKHLSIGIIYNPDSALAIWDLCVHKNGLVYFTTHIPMDLR